jgi:hypothetical protein
MSLNFEIREKMKKLNCEMESANETNEILGDEETLKAIEEGLQDIKIGKVIRFEDFLRTHGYGKNQSNP